MVPLILHREIMTLRAKVLFLFAILSISLDNHLVSALQCYKCDDDGPELGCNKEVDCPNGDKFSKTLL